MKDSCIVKCPHSVLCDWSAWGTKAVLKVGMYIFFAWQSID